MTTGSGVQGRTQEQIDRAGVEARRAAAEREDRPSTEAWKRRSLYQVALRMLRMLGSWTRSVLGDEAPEVRALADTYRTFERGKPSS